MLMSVHAAIFVFGLAMPPMFEAGLVGAILAMTIGMSLVGLAYGPLGTVLAELFPTAVRYTGSSLTFNLAGIFGASLAPYAATWLATTYGPLSRRLLSLRIDAPDAYRAGIGARDQGHIPLDDE